MKVVTLSKDMWDNSLKEAIEWWNIYFKKDLDGCQEHVEEKSSHEWSQSEAGDAMNLDQDT